MKSVDYRNDTWDRVRGDLSRLRLEVYEALRIVGPATCRELAANMLRDLNSVAPRVTELCQLGFAELDGENADEYGRGRYVALSEQSARERFFYKQHRAREGGEQILMKL